MRDYVQQDRTYVEFLRRKVEKARKSTGGGIGRSDEEVGADFAKRRAEWERKAEA